MYVQALCQHIGRRLIVRSINQRKHFAGCTRGFLRGNQVVDHLHLPGHAFDFLIEPGHSGEAWLGMPPGKENCLNNFCSPASSWLMFG